MKMTAISIQQFTVATSLLLVSLLVDIVAAQAETYPNNDANEERLQTKPWLMKNLNVAGVPLPFSPVTLIVLWVSISYLYSVLFDSGPQTLAMASHILMDDKDKLEQFKAKIGNNATVFAKYAKEHSTCPSKQQGGNLGRFKQGVMAPPFDKAVFDPATAVGTTIGPIQTQFGWHLIYVHERTLAK